MVLIVVVFVVCARRDVIASLEVRGVKDLFCRHAPARLLSSPQSQHAHHTPNTKPNHTATMASDEEDGTAMSLDESSINLTPSTAATPSNQQQRAATHYNHPLAAANPHSLQ